MGASHTVSAGGLSATLAPEVGGRIGSLRVGGVELLWTDFEARGGERAPFPLPGGDKVWIAPQSAWPGGRPYPALDLAAWEWDGALQEMRSPVEPALGIRLVRRVSAAPDGDGLLVETRLEGEPSAAIGLWQVSQLRLPGLARLPGATVQLGDEARDSAAAPRRAGEATEVRTGGRGPWKLSSAEPCRWVEAEVAGVRLRRSVVGDGPAGRGEVYDSDRLGYWELELHAPLGARAHRERWTAEAIGA